MNFNSKGKIKAVVHASRMLIVTEKIIVKSKKNR